MKARFCFPSVKPGDSALALVEYGCQHSRGHTLRLAYWNSGGVRNASGGQAPERRTHMLTKTAPGCPRALAGGGMVRSFSAGLGEEAHAELVGVAIAALHRSA